MFRSAIYFATLALIGCAAQPCAPPPDPIVQVQKVPYPVPVARTPSPELLACPTMPPGWKLPVFVKPDKCVSGDAHVCVKGDPAATSALTPDGEAALRAWIEAQSTCIAGWHDWATSKAPLQLPGDAPAAPSP